MGPRAVCVASAGGRLTGAVSHVWLPHTTSMRVGLRVVRLATWVPVRGLAAGNLRVRARPRAGGNLGGAPGYLGAAADVSGLLAGASCCGAWCCRRAAGYPGGTWVCWAWCSYRCCLIDAIRETCRPGAAGVAGHLDALLRPPLGPPPQPSTETLLLLFPARLLCVCLFHCFLLCLCCS